MAPSEAVVHFRHLANQGVFVRYGEENSNQAWLRFGLSTLPLENMRQILISTKY